MGQKIMLRDIELIYVIINFGQAGKLIRVARQNGIAGATVTMGMGTAHNRIFDFIGLSDIRKEVVFLAAEKETAYRVLAQLDREFEFSKPNHGIAFTTSICGVVGTKSTACEDNPDAKNADQIKYHIITTIVDKGKAEFVMAAAEKAGAKGGTVINARGTGIHETGMLFSMEVEPEKEMVLIFSQAETTRAIVDSVRTELKLDDPGNGIIFIQSANKAYGIYR